MKRGFVCAAKGVLSIALVALAGCATVRSTVDVPTAVAKPATTAPAKAYVTIAKVTDNRIFEANPRIPSTPSLEKAEEINDPAIRSRAIARKRNSYGMAMADILLPEGRTVESIVREAATQALQEKGYGVVDAKSPEAAKALPVELTIKQFWAWFTPGFFTISLEYQGIVEIESAVLPADKEVVRGYARVNSMAATDEEWKNVVTQGVSDLAVKLKAAFPEPK